MEWNLFWAIAAQTLIGAVILVILAMAVSLVVHMLRGTVKAKVEERPYNPPRYPKIPEATWSKSEPVGVPEMRKRGVDVDGPQDIDDATSGYPAASRPTPVSKSGRR